ncbi:optic atrophy 3 protein-domain-containing protein [Leucosporidium creatinivorum]|uniref:Optic atrophy 3 protein-domain-containing protein n=1 Tax=Leucosporidium creatinivorum TaxID=106004 RepID=A0A1Y2F3H9_9BASI|nr:optic atrophy 3 protein-domain-containing protein [Leucosporidium creatinivorum]
MASVKIASLLLKTLSKPIANRLKRGAKEHERFREMTIEFAQFLHRSEMTMRVKLLGETHPKHIRPLNDARAIDAGANFISESFLFAFAAAIIMGETWRSRRAEGKRRDAVQDQLDSYGVEIAGLKEALVEERSEREAGVSRERDLEKIVEEIVAIGLRGGFIDVSPQWESHVRIGQQARAFGTYDRAVTDEPDHEELESAPRSVVVEELNRSKEQLAEREGSLLESNGGP